MPIILERDKHSDEFNRQPLANALSKVLLEHDSARLPLNVGIFGAWGIGKTQFMTMIKKEVLDLSKPKPKIVLFEPWKYESRQDVGLGLMLAIVRAVEDDKSTTAKIKTQARNAGYFIWKVLSKTTSAITDKATGIDPETIIKDSLNEVRIGSPRIQTEIDEALDQLRRLIHKWVGKNGRCFVFVDDLDRCLPDQMIALVEALHLYMTDTPCYFTVGMDQDAMSAALRQRYGSLDTDIGRVYLDKIFPVSMNLSPPTNRQLLDRYRKLLAAEELTEDSIDFVLKYVEQNPRSLERFLNNYSLSRRLVSVRHDLENRIIPDLLVLLMVIKVRFPDLFGALPKVPMEAVSEFARVVKDGDAPELKASMEQHGGNALLPYGEDGTETRSFFYSLSDYWAGLLIRPILLKELLAFTDV